MTIDWWTLGLQTINVAVLVWILARYLFRPVSRILAERQAAIHAALSQAEEARAEATAARDAAEAETETIAAQRTKIMATAKDEAEREKARLIDEARAAAATARAEAKAELARMRAAQKRALAEEAGDLATDIAARLLARLPDSARIDGFIDGIADAIADLPESTRAGIGTDGPVRICAARALTPAERDHLERRLDEALGHPSDLKIEAEPALLAGLELIAPHAVVRNSFRADLRRIRVGLTQHG